MYRIPARQIVGGPRWLQDDRYDVEARADKKFSVDDLDAIYQNLLIDRFHLRYHLETKEESVYALTIDSSGANSRLATSPRITTFP